MRAPRVIPHSIDAKLLVVVLGLTVLGLIMVWSASSIVAEERFDDAYLFIRKQLIYVGLGTMGMMMMAFTPIKLLIRLKYLWLFLAIAMLTATLIGPLAHNANGARRWLELGGVSFQPMEFTKVALVLYLAWFFSEKQPQIKTFWVGVVPPFVITGIIGLLLLRQPDFGGAAFMAALLLFMCLVGGTSLIHLAGSLILLSALGWLFIVQSPYRLQRWMSFLDPFEDALGAGYQVVQSLYAFGAGGWSGVGLGASKQKLFFLPEAHNDFILAILGEELGFFGVSLLFLLMGLLLWRAFAIALAGRDLQERLVGYGAALIICLGAMLNAAVVMGVVPPKGVPMPFISYGGSSLIVCFLSCGLLLNLSRRQGAREGAKP